MEAGTSLLLMAAKLLPEEELISLIDDALQKHKDEPSEETRKTLSMHCMLFATRVATEKKDLFDTMMDLEKQVERNKLFKDKVN